MTRWRPQAVEVLLAALCAGSAALFLAGLGTGPLLTTPLTFLAVLMHRRRPLMAALAVLGITVLLDGFLGVPSENPGMLAAWLVVAYALGRYAAWRAGAVALAAFVTFAAVATQPPDPRFVTAVFVAVLFGTSWAFGFVVRRRTDDVRRSAAEASGLALLDPAVRAAHVVAEERTRLAGEVVRVIRTRVQAMQRHASDAESDLAPAALERVQEEGRRAVAELRRLLGLLRAEDQLPVAPTPPPRPGWRVDLAIAVGLAALFLLEFFLGLEAMPVTGAVVGVLLVAVVALRRVDSMLACLLALSVVAAAEMLDVPVPYAAGHAAVFVLLAWSVAVQGRWRSYVALGALMVVVVADVYRFAPGNEAMTVAAFALGGLAGHVWAARDRQERRAAAAAAALRSEHDAVAARAVRAERLRLARELHDVTSHAVGVMVLQAGAAQALRAQDPEQAREAVRTVQATGREALRELDALAGLLDAGAVGPAGLAGSRPDRDLAPALQALADRIRAAGVQVSLALPGALPADDDVTATVYRVVQEALTNTTRYAPQSRVEVEVRAGGDVLEVEVRDDGVRRATGPAPQGGFGLVGLAERVRALGGEFAAGPRPEGGFAVTARLPVASEVEVGP